MLAGCDVDRPVVPRRRTPIDQARVEELVGQLAGHMTGAMLCLAVWLGDELGYYRALADGGAMAADDLAGTTGCNPRLTREWLDGQASAGLVSYDATGDRYSMSGEVAALLADESTPTFMARRDEQHHRDGRRRREGPRRVSRRRRTQLGRPPSLPVPRHRVVLPPGVPGVPDLDVDTRARRRRSAAARRSAASPTSAAVTVRRSW